MNRVLFVPVAVLLLAAMAALVFVCAFLGEGSVLTQGSGQITETANTAAVVCVTVLTWAATAAIRRA
jgi:hypothetical protein